MGTALIKRPDMSRCGPLLVDIRDQFGFGIDVYPKTLVVGHAMLEDYVRSRRLYPKRRNSKNSHNKSKPEPKSKESETGVMYAQEKLVPGTNGKFQATVQCHGCEKFGHDLSHCPGDDERENLNVGDEVEREEEDEGK